MLNDLIVERDPPEKRRKYCEGSKEHCLPEAAVMLAFTMHLLKSEPGVRHGYMYPDGMHGKGFKIREWLERQGFTHSGGSGRTTYAGEYCMKDKVVTISPKPGFADVTAKGNGSPIVAECKGGCINTKHPGQVSHLRMGLYQVIGHLMARDPKANERHVAVVPDTKETRKIAQRMAARALRGGIEIALVDHTGRVRFTPVEPPNQPGTIMIDLGSDLNLIS